ncbi:O-antigen assembly polymerase [Testudinibacter sp. TR-2022]|uniref:ECA oligosaccharide polymerase n=1 Tax=Testudinibacter sp. TR-2022 TaxID=2585029 RepID=UPI00111B92D6|nr:ECA oligosaccharide polymerase [Testudinibacter sp. TR-2022]TNH04542.1 O-antigen assembly polymerase [Pasteurellaceae bacterium Phil31]TNH07809.1 O-antigen assembly polymerase [Testudinibacter sp. TR-2022]TNH11231.1 O-antigen assembly polymerase [Testudinibacter sp. TR-2022]TNH14473.1 O-antigen assembly polymerase [Testudinibacter sp. TR-2022]TNH14754.1 O-antigen assembly polymerase [Testudinibacter sp. TR-2022]
MLTLAQLSILVLLYTFSVILIGYLAYQSFKKVRFSFHLLFTLVYLLTFYLGFPFSMVLAFGFNVPLLPFEILFIAQFSALIFYLLYYVAYQVRLLPRKIQPVTVTVATARQYSASEAIIAGVILLLVALVTIGLFFSFNGFLLFKLDSYSQIFSQSVSGTALKRFFYFFLPALLIFYFLKPSKLNWLLFLLFGVSFGVLTYLLVGGTRANIALAVAIFFFIGISKGYISITTLAIAGGVAIVAMFGLALARYGLDVSGSEAFYTFLYLTRDTFSPWENLALLFSYYQKIEFQGLAPIIRDFYVFIPKGLWENRPDLVVNSANYFTWEVLNYYAGLAISPTLLGSFLIMGGVPLMVLGAWLCGWLLKAMDFFYQYGKSTLHRSNGALIQAYCFANIFNIIVLVREGMDAFVSRFVFFALIFAIAVVLAKVIVLLFRQTNSVQIKLIKS